MMILHAYLFPYLYYWPVLIFWSAGPVIIGGIALLLQSIVQKAVMQWRTLLYCLAVGLGIWSLQVAFSTYQLLLFANAHAPVHGISPAYLRSMGTLYGSNLASCQLQFILLLACIALLLLLEIPSLRRTIKVRRQEKHLEDLLEKARNQHVQRWLGVATFCYGGSLLAIGGFIGTMLYPPIKYGAMFPPQLALTPPALPTLLGMLIATIGGPLLFLLLGIQYFLERQPPSSREKMLLEEQENTSRWYKHLTIIATLFLLLISLVTLIFTHIISQNLGNDPFGQIVFTASLGLSGLFLLSCALILLVFPHKDPAMPRAARDESPGESRNVARDR